MRTRKLNQDCLENFFGNVRSRGGNCYNPTLFQFICTFKKLFSLNFIQHSKRGNCEDDFETLLNDLSTADPPPLHLIEEEKILYLPKEEDYQTLNLPYENALQYVCGYLYKKMPHKTYLRSMFGIYSKNITEVKSTMIFTYKKAYETTESSTFGSLFTSSISFVNFPIQYLSKLFCKIKIFYTLQHTNDNLKSLPRKSRKYVTLCNLYL